MGTLKLQNNAPLYSNTVTGILGVDGRAVTFGTAKRGTGRAAARPVPIQGHYTNFNFILFDVALVSGLVLNCAVLLCLTYLAMFYFATFFFVIFLSIAAFAGE